jgi:hypothetical protein
LYADLRSDFGIVFEGLFYPISPFKIFQGDWCLLPVGSGKLRKWVLLQVGSCKILKLLKKHFHVFLPVGFPRKNLCAMCMSLFDDE